MLDLFRDSRVPFFQATQFFVSDLQHRCSIHFQFFACFVQLVCQGFDQLTLRDYVEPVIWDSTLAVEGAGDLTADGAPRIRVITEVDCLYERILKGVGPVEGPLCGLKTLDDIAGSPDLWWVFA